MSFDYFSFDWLNFVILPCATTLVLLYFYRRITKTERITNDAKLNTILQQLIGLVKEIRLEFDSPAATVYKPIILAAVLLVILKFFGLLGGSYGFPLWLAIPISSILAPINEEIIIRGFFFGVFVLTLMHCVNLLVRGKIRQKEFVFEKLPTYLVITGILLQAALFGWLHEKNLFSLEGHNWADVLSRSLSGAASGWLFYYSRKNLLPAMVFHSAWNTIVIFSDQFVLF